MNKKTFKAVSPGAWVEPVLKGYRMACCDCCLVHKMEFRVRNGRPQMRAWRDSRSTSYLRRREGVSLDGGRTKKAVG